MIQTVVRCNIVINSPLRYVVQHRVQQSTLVLLCSQTRTVTADCLKLLTYTVNGSCIYIISDTNSRTFQDDLIIEILHNLVIPGDLHYFLK